MKMLIQKGKSEIKQQRFQYHMTQMEVKLCGPVSQLTTCYRLLYLQ